MSLPTPEELMALPPQFLAEDVGHRLVNATIPLTVIITIVFALFIASRVAYSDRNGWDVWVFYPLSYLSCLGVCICCYLYVSIGGVGRHFAYWLLTDPAMLNTTLKIQTGAEFLYINGVTSPKIALLMLYLKIFVDPNVRRWTYVTLALVVCNYFATGFGTYFAICQPFAFKWDKTIPGGKCGDIMGVYRYASIPNIVTDLLILVLPLSSLRKLNTNKMRKVGIFVTFLMGSLGLVTSIVRFVGFFTVDLTADVTFYTTDTMIYTLIETCAYFVCSCLPGIRPLARAMYVKAGFGGLTTKGSGGRTAPSNISLGNMASNHKATVTSTPGVTTRSVDSDRDGFIRLEETVHVDYSSARSLDGESIKYAHRHV
jgi:hypothetical protein